MASVALLFGLSLSVNLAGWAVSSALVTDHFYDLTGAVTHILVALASLFYAPAPGLRQVAGTVLIVVWATRLGAFLFARISASGGDKRLAKYKTRPLIFLIPWTIQSIWILLNCLPIALANAASSGGPAFGLLDVVAIAAWLAGFTVQVVADEEKRLFSANPSNAGRWISTGTWAVSRHPNYVGEILMGWALAALAWSSLDGWAALGALAPVFETWLLLRVSGVPLLEKAAEKKWGADPEYRRYVAATPVLVPLPRWLSGSV